MNKYEWLIKIHSYSFENEEIIKGKECVCLYCKEKFNANEVESWCDDKNGRTAICPYCYVDCVVPLSIDGVYYLSDEDIDALYDFWFNADTEEMDNFFSNMKSDNEI